MKILKKYIIFGIIFKAGAYHLIGYVHVRVDCYTEPKSFNRTL